MKRPILIAVFLLALYGRAIAQEMPNIVPPSPEAASLGKFSEVPISHYTGLPNISVPMASFEVGGKTFPVNISYHARGIMVSEVASRAGIGWAVNAGGQITRQVRDRDDFHSGPDFSLIGALASESFFTDEDTRDSYWEAAIIEDVKPDKIPDLYHLQVGNLSAKFIFDYKDGNPLLQKFDDIEIERTAGTPGGFVVTDKDGFKYYFGVPDYDQADINLVINISDYSQSTPEGDLTSYSTWHLTKITSPNGDEANLLYDEEVSGYLYRRNYDKYNGGPGFQSFASRFTSHQYQLSEIRYNYGSSNSYSSIVFEANDPRDDYFGNELDAIKIYDKNSTLIRSFNLHQSYMVSPGDTANTNYYYTVFEPKSFKRLVLDSITEVGKNGASKPPYKFHYDPQILPNRFSNSQDFWGYYNGAENGKFLPLLNYYYAPYDGVDYIALPFTDITTDRTVDLDKSRAGMLERIEYPTGGSVTFTYEHNQGVKGIEMDGIDLPQINPISSENEAISYLEPNLYNGNKYIGEPFVVNDLFGMVKFNVTLPYDYNNSNQNDVCSDPPGSGCAFDIKLEGLNGAPDYNFIYAGIQEFEVEPGEYRLVVDPLQTWYPNPPPGSQPGDYFFSVFMSWKEQTVDESEILYASGKRIKRIEFYDTDGSLTHFKEYDYRTESGLPSGVILGLSSFLSIRRYPTHTPSGSSLDHGPVTFVEPLGAIPGSPLSTYQGNSIGYSRVTEFNGDSLDNIGKTDYSFTVTRDSGVDFAYENGNSSLIDSYMSNPYHPPTDSEWLRGLPVDIVYSKNTNGSYSKVKSVHNQYLYAGDESQSAAIFGPLTTRLDLTEDFTDQSKYYFKDDKMFRLPLIAPYLSDDDTPGVIDYEHPEYKVYHFTGGTVDLLYTTETLYDDSENPTLVTQTKTEYNYGNHYQPVKVSTVTSDGMPVIQTFVYPPDIASPSSAVQGLIDQNRLVNLETRTYKDADVDNNPETSEQTGITVTTYAYDGNILEPSLVQVGKNSGSSLENRIKFDDYDDKGNLLQVSRDEGTDITYVYGYNRRLPIAKVENATYTEVQSYVPNLQSLSDADDDRSVGTAGNEGALRSALDALRANLPDAMVTTYTYDPLVGVTSITDPRGQTAYYEYDSFNRLKYVRDSDGNILSGNEYHYADQN